MGHFMPILLMKLGLTRKVAHVINIELVFHYSKQAIGDDDACSHRATETEDGCGRS
jgi:nitrate reductase NapAB chaperone NapD